MHPFGSKAKKSLVLSFSPKIKEKLLEKSSKNRYEYGLFDIEFPTYEVINDENIVLEVKFNEVLPEAISIILSTVPMYREAVSKFALCRSIK